MRIGVFGGSFDPIHTGHLILAEQCREQAQLDQVLFVPAAASPHKPQGPTATARQRLEMVQLALAGHDAFAVSTLEMDRGGLSYTVDTLRELVRSAPDGQWFLMMGADTLRDFDSWREPQAICQMASILVVRRPGTQVQRPQSAGVHPSHDRPATAGCRLQEIDLPAIEISSSDIRHRVAAAKSIRYLVPRAVEMYIQTHRVYAAREAVDEQALR